MDAFSSQIPAAHLSEANGSSSATSGGSRTATGQGSSAISQPQMPQGNMEGRANLNQPTPLPAACLYCRSKHLKCDGQSPCSRCLSTDEECVYVASRRGYKGPRRAPAQNPNKRRASSPPPSGGGDASGNATAATNANLNENAASCSLYMPAGATLSATSIPAAVPPYNPSVMGEAPFETLFISAQGRGVLDMHFSPDISRQFAMMPSNDLVLAPANAQAVGSTPPNAAFQTRPASLADRCLDAYYFYHFGSHPFVLPKEPLLRLTGEDTPNLPALLAAIRYVGSFFILAGPARASFLDEALRGICLPSAPKDGFLIQTMLLLLIGLDGATEGEKSRELLADAERLSIEMGLNGRQYASAHGRGDAVMEESWRRTWWELYVVDGIIAGVHRMTSFFLFDIETDVGLPCEEREYLVGNIPPPIYLEDFEDQGFSDEDREFSSFAYRVGSARNLGRMMRMPPNVFPLDAGIARADAMLTNWRLHLPDGKRDHLDKNCQLDEMMFQARFMNLACTIMLHQPLSQLDSSPVQAVTSCAPYRHVPSGDAFNLHTRHTLWAASEVSRLVTLPVPILRHTHFFTCVITMSSIVHLSKWAMYLIQDEDELRQQIRLNIGALQKLRGVWSNAARAWEQVNGVAREIYREKKAQQISPAFWVGFTQEEMMNSISVDEQVMGEFENALAQGASAEGV